jgi:hypothetical protein
MISIHASIIFIQKSVNKAVATYVIIRHKSRKVDLYRREGKIFLRSIFYTEIWKFCHQI